MPETNTETETQVKEGPILQCKWRCRNCGKNTPYLDIKCLYCGRQRWSDEPMSLTKHEAEFLRDTIVDGE